MFKLTIVRSSKKCIFLIRRDKDSIKTNIQHETHMVYIHGLHVLGKFELSKKISCYITILEVKKRTLQPWKKLLRHFNASIVSRKNKVALLPTPGAMLLRLNSSSMHFLCYRKQHCSGVGGKQSFNLQQ